MLDFISERSAGIPCNNTVCHWYNKNFDQSCSMADHDGNGDPGPAFCTAYFPREETTKREDDSVKYVNSEEFEHGRKTVTDHIAEINNMMKEAGDDRVMEILDTEYLKRKLTCVFVDGDTTKLSEFLKKHVPGSEYCLEPEESGAILNMRM